MIQLLYSSVATQEIGEEEINRILHAAKQNNTKLDVTGLLLFRVGFFLQLLEGEAAHVHSILERIRKDPRHGDLKILIEGPCEERLFPDWNMGYIKEPLTHPGLKKLWQNHAKADKAKPRARILQTIRAFAKVIPVKPA